MRCFLLRCRSAASYFYWAREPTHIAKHLTMAVLVLWATDASRATASSLEQEEAFAQFASKDGAFTLRTALYLQARAEYGDLYRGDAPIIEQDAFDAYFRKAAIGFYGHAYTDAFTYGLTLSADETPQSRVYPSYDDTQGVSLNGTYLAYRFSPTLAVRFGKEKLPYSRLYLMSSTRQAFSERPYYMYTWEQVLSEYAQTHLSVIGSWRSFDYWASIAQGWRAGDVLSTTRSVTDAPPQMTMRLQWSPAHWKENRMSDAFLGQGRHFSIGTYAAIQNDIEYRGRAGLRGSEDRSLFGADVSYHLNNVSLAAEWNSWQIADSSEITQAGWLVQGGYFFPSYNLEPVVRYEHFDTDVDRNETSVMKTTFGVNYYLRGHKLKWMLNYEHTRFDDAATFLRPDGNDSSQAIRATLQFLL